MGTACAWWPSTTSGTSPSSAPRRRGSAMSESPDPRPLTPRLLRDWPLPMPDGGEHERGDVLVVGGSPGTVGGVLLAGVAALRAGAGVLRMAVAESGAA